MTKHFVSLSLRFPKTVVALTLLATIFFAAQFPKARIDTDPENMLETNQLDRVFYRQVKQEFGIRDLLVVGLVDEQGVLRVPTLEKLSRAAEQILAIPGVVAEDVVSLATSDNITAREGSLEIRKFLAEPPRTDEALAQLRRELFGNPFYVGKIISANGKATALYVPIQDKKLSHTIAGQIEDILKEEFPPPAAGEAGVRYHIAGLPVTEETFGQEMFVQMGVVAPITGLFLFVLMWFLFRRWTLLVPAMLLMMVSVIWTMGAMIGLGYTVHIMSSMTPIFLMPIAVLDSVHILSWFYDRYPQYRDRRKTLESVLTELFQPCLYTSVTSAVGFASLGLAPIPPVQIHGVNVAFGIMVAWLLTFTFLPACMMFVREESLGRSLAMGNASARFYERFLPRLGAFAFGRAKLVVAVAVVLLGLSVAAITQIRVNDNPVRWFKAHHKIRIADRVMNEHFGGTYEAYLVVEGGQPDTMKRPEVMGYIARLQRALEANPHVGKTSSVADIVRRINFVLHGEQAAFDTVPGEQNAIAQLLFLFSISGDPNDLDNFLTADARKANIWVQMKSGDNRDMSSVEETVAAFTRAEPPPVGVQLRWSGLTYINRIWQGLMVTGMLRAVLGSFVVVFVLMAILLRSLLWGIVSMLPLTVAIVFCYGLLGLFGKDYDMPIAVCSTLSLGLSVDFAIHFLTKFREFARRGGDAERVNRELFGETARAIWRNAIVITLTFLPMMFAPLTPYVTVGLFFAALMIASAAATLVLLPALIRLLPMPGAQSRQRQPVTS